MARVENVSKGINFNQLANEARAMLGHTEPEQLEDLRWHFMERWVECDSLTQQQLEQLVNDHNADPWGHLPPWAKRLRELYDKEEGGEPLTGPENAEAAQLMRKAHFHPGLGATPGVIE